MNNTEVVEIEGLCWEDGCDRPAAASLELSGKIAGLKERTERDYCFEHFEYMLTRLVRVFRLEELRRA